MNVDLLLYVGIFVVSLFGLLKASDWFVESSESIGLSFGISPFVIGVTIVAFGTSLPELASSIAAVLDGESAIVTGNVIGSNVANICLVLGIVALVANGINMDDGVIDIDIPVLVTSALLLWVFTRDGAISILDGILLFGMLIIFLLNSVKMRGTSHEGERLPAETRAYVFLVLGAVGVYFGARYVVVSIQEISAAIGISSGIIAMSVIALGTSLPEVIVSLAAARKGNAAMAVGNVVGSNIFNSFGVMGIPAFFGEFVVLPEDIAFSLPFMIGITVLMGFLAVAKNISRWEGVLLLGLYIIFMVQLFTPA